MVSSCISNMELSSIQKMRVLNIVLNNFIKENKQNDKELSELERKLNYISLPALKRSSQNNTIYKNYRWLYVKRVEQPPEQISDTIVTKFKSPEIRFIAMIDIKKTK